MSDIELALRAEAEARFIGGHVSGWGETVSLLIDLAARVRDLADENKRLREEIDTRKIELSDWQEKYTEAMDNIGDFIRREQGFDQEAKDAYESGFEDGRDYAP